jgi:putative DNA primase/helicase
MLDEKQINAIPKEVRELAQWLPWRWVPAPGKTKPDKELIDPRTGIKALWGNSKTWMPFGEAVDAARKGEHTGVGFIFAKHDKYAGLDFDYCYDPATKEIEPWAAERIPQHTYCEISPSGNGIKCLGYGCMPGDGTGHVKKVHALLNTRCPDAEIGAYSQKRWFAFTGNALNGSHVREIQSAIDRLDREIFSVRLPDTATPTTKPQSATGARVAEPEPAVTRIRAMPDEEILRRVAAGNQSEKFLRLWAGDSSGYPSGSEADFALCGILAYWTGGDTDRVERLFARSALGKLPRLKAGEARRTSKHACVTATKFWTPDRLVVPTDYDIRPLAELLAKDFGPEEFVLEGVLPKGGTSILAAKPKVGKTTFTRQEMLAVARGARFLERNVIAGPVVLLSFQGREADIQRNLKLLGATPDDPIFWYCGRPPQGAVEKLYELAERFRPALIVVEMLQHLIRVKDTNAYGEVSLAMEPVEDVARQSGAHIQFTQHFGKTEREDPADQIMGSTGFRGVVDTSIMLRRYAEYRTITTEQRIGSDLPETVLKWNEEQKCIYLGEARAPLERITVEEKILVALRASEHPMTQSEIVDKLQASRGKVLDALDRIEKYKSRQIIRTGRGCRGDPTRYAINPDFRNVVEFPATDS